MGNNFHKHNWVDNSYIYILSDKKIYKDIESATLFKNNLIKKEFLLINDHQETLNNKEFIRKLNKDELKELKRIIKKSKKSKFDYALDNSLTSTLETNVIPNSPNYILELRVTNNKNIYLFLWLYESQEKAFVSYLKTEKSKTVDLIINPKDTKALKCIIEK